MEQKPGDISKTGASMPPFAIIMRNLYLACPIISIPEKEGILKGAPTGAKCRVVSPGRGNGEMPD